VESQLNLWQALLVGLLGAAIGGILSFIGSVVGAKLTSGSASKLAQQERHQRELLIRKTAVSGLLAEIRDNLALGRDPLTGYSKATFISDLWQAHKGNTEFLALDTQEYLRKGYASVFLANSVVMYELNLLKHGSGYYDEDYKKRVSDMKAAFSKSEGALKAWLDSNSRATITRL